MGLFVVLLLAGLWMSILLPGVYRARWELSRIDSAHSFQRTMSRLGRRCGSTYQVDSRPLGRHVLVLNDAASVAGSIARSRMRRRQREVLAQLGTAACVTGGLAIGIGDLLWPVFGVAAATFVGYTLVVAQVRAHEAERLEKVRDIRPAGRPGPATHGNTTSNVRIQRWVG